MRPRRLTLAAALLAAIVLALAACSGGGTPPAPTATPEASPAAEAPSTPTPTAEAPSTPAPTAEATPTPSPAPTPEPPPEQACANGVAVEEPEARPGLVADCVALLASRDALRGEASLDWGGDLAIGRWEGVAVGGEPPRVTGLDLRDKGLTGAIPRTLGEMERLSTLILADNALTGGIPRPIGRLPWLDEVRLAGNALTGCVPSAFGDARGDALYLGLPWCLRYDRLDATGEVAEAGGWAILGADGEVLATWEGLRSEAATLRVHQTDAGGTSWAAEFGAVSEGGLFEWRKASDCWVRYLVTGPPVRPTAGSGRWEFPVEWMTYAATGEGCTGAVGASAVLGADEAPPDAVRSSEVALLGAPVRHGPFLMVPVGWTGVIEPEVEVAATPPVFRAPEGSGASGSADQSVDSTAPEWPDGYPHASQLRRYQMRLDDTAPDWPTTYSRKMSPAEVRQHPLWREPVMPPGWYMLTAKVTLRGYEAYYTNAQGFAAARIRIWWLPWEPYTGHVIDHPTRIHELRIIDGHPAQVRYGSLGIHHPAAYVIIYDKSTGIEYEVKGEDASLRKGDIDATIAIARSLLPAADTP